jgi:hypothetical protein
MKMIIEACIFYSDRFGAWFTLARKSDNQKFMCAVAPDKLESIGRVRCMAAQHNYHWPKHVAIEDGATMATQADIEEQFADKHKLKKANHTVTVNYNISEN